MFITYLEKHNVHTEKQKCIIMCYAEMISGECQRISASCLARNQAAGRRKTIGLRVTSKGCTWFRNQCILQQLLHNCLLRGWTLTLSLCLLHFLSFLSRRIMVPALDAIIQYQSGRVSYHPNPVSNEIINIKVMFVWKVIILRKGL